MVNYSPASFHVPAPPTGRFRVPRHPSRPVRPVRSLPSRDTRKNGVQRCPSRRVARHVGWRCALPYVGWRYALPYVGWRYALPYAIFLKPTVPSGMAPSRGGYAGWRCALPYAPLFKPYGQTSRTSRPPRFPRPTIKNRRAHARIPTKCVTFAATTVRQPYNNRTTTVRQPYNQRQWTTTAQRRATRHATPQ